MNCAPGVMSAYPSDDEQLGALPALVITTGAALAKDAIEAAKKQASRMAQNASWYAMALTGDRAALAQLHTMGGQGTQADRQTILAATGEDIGPGPWGWASADAQKDAISKYNQVVTKLNIPPTSGNPNLEGIKAVVTSPAILAGVALLVVFAATRGTRRHV